MSSGGGTYVVSNAERQARMRRVVADRVRQLDEEFAIALAALGAHTGDRRPGHGARPRLPARPADDATLDDLEAWEAAARPVVERLTAAAEAERSRRGAADLADHLRSIVASGELATPYRMRADIVDVPGLEASRHAEPTVDWLTARIESTVAGLTADASDVERERVQEAARAVLVPSTLHPATLLTELRVLVQDIDKAATERRSARERAQRLLRKLDGLVGSEVDDLRELVERVIAGKTPLLGVDEARVEELRARAIAEEDRRYVARHLAGAFVDRGYVVDRGFAERLAAGEPAYAFVRESLDHAAEVRLESDGRYTFGLVHAATDADRRRDVDYELSLCKAVGRITLDARDRGMQFDLDRDSYVPAGRRHVRYSEVAASQRSRSRVRGAPKQRERRP